MGACKTGIQKITILRHLVDRIGQQNRRYSVGCRLFLSVYGSKIARFLLYGALFNQNPFVLIGVRV